MVSNLLLAAFLATANEATAFAPIPKWVSGSSNTASQLNAASSGWKGGFRDSNPDYAFGTQKPDLSDLPITGNLDNIPKITRMQKILWPQFSWQSIPGDESTRVYEMFAQDISRIGYDDEGRIWSIICPQRGASAGILGTIMLEVTVTGIRGWVDEPTQSACADMGVTGCLWIEPGDNPFIAAIAELLDYKKLPFSKDNAAKVRGHAVGKPYEDYWQMSNGTDPLFFHPQFAQHWEEAYSVYNLQVEIGEQLLIGDELVDDFNAMIIKTFNGVKNNILAQGQKVAWNVWAGEPEIVDTEEWQSHADLWLKSITVNHEYPTGDPGCPRYFDGSPVEPSMKLDEQVDIVKEFLVKHGDEIKKGVQDTSKLDFIRFFTHHVRVEKTLFGRLKKKISKK